LPIAFWFVIDNSNSMKDPLISLPGYALRRAANVTAAELSARLAPFELRQSDISLLMLVEANPGITSSALGRQLDIQRANMVPILKRLEDAGLIDRAPIDGKSQGLALTAAGRAKLAEGRKVIEAFERELIGRVPAEHRAHLLPALNAIWR
jgi:DNA-binding MarR family transcriptional regulator